MKIKVTPEEFLNGKFGKTITIIEILISEAMSANDVKRGYTASAVKSRVEQLYSTFLKDLKKLSEDIGEDFIVDMKKLPSEPEVNEPEKPREKIKSEVKGL